ncbi:hypothetical protein [Pseudomonas sp. Tri1]|uniref:hypothetical protein n=1 Tax=Pseudomonas sp. Tri1 TaxID=2823875 RepID=UPI001B3261FA|nr:hypothetical protein [Pseudomonas sp. Tri1]
MSAGGFDWERQGKTIEGLIEELQSFQDKNIKVELSLDGGVTSKPISLVAKKNGICLLVSVSIEE